MKQAVSKLTIGCLLLKNPCCILAPQCCTLLQPLTCFVGTFSPDSEDKVWPTLPHAWRTETWLEQPSALTQSLRSNHSAHVFNHNQSGHHKNSHGWNSFGVDYLLLSVSAACVWESGGVYSLIRVLLSMSPHCIRQSRLEEKHLTLIPVILRGREREKMLHYLTDCTGDQYGQIKLWKQMKRGETKPNPTASSPRAVLMLSLTLNPSVPSTERERVYLFTEILVVVV